MIYNLTWPSENIAPTFNRRTIEDLMKTPAPIVQSQKSTQIEDDMKSVIFENEPLPDLDQFEDQDHMESDEELPPLPPRYIVLLLNYQLCSLRIGMNNDGPI